MQTSTWEYKFLFLNQEPRANMCLQTACPKFKINRYHDMDVMFDTRKKSEKPLRTELIFNSCDKKKKKGRIEERAE